MSAAVAMKAPVAPRQGLVFEDLSVGQQIDTLSKGPLTTAHLVAFPAIWIALGLYVSALLRAPRLPQPPE